MALTPKILPDHSSTLHRLAPICQLPDRPPRLRLDWICPGSLCQFALCFTSVFRPPELKSGSQEPRNLRKKTSPLKTTPSKTSHQPPTPTDGDAIEMVLVPSGFTWISPKQSNFRLTATQGPSTSAAGPEMAAAPHGSGVGLPVFRLMPRQSYEGKLPPYDVPPPLEHPTRAYGGHDLIISGSMSDDVHGPPSIRLTPDARRIQGPSKPHTEAKRKK
jgi:hypothetical protein